MSPPRDIYSERLNQPVVVNSVYNRASDAAQWNVFDSSRPVPGDRGATSGEFLVRDGENVVAVLNNDLTTRQAQHGHQFTITVREPDQYEGAAIAGRVGSVDQGGRLTGSIRDIAQLRDDQAAQMVGLTSSLDVSRTSKRSNDDTIKVDNEGSAQGDNQTTQTLERAGIGTAIGAITGGGQRCGDGWYHWRRRRSGLGLCSGQRSS